MWFGHGLGPFGHTQPGGLGPALTMVPTIDNFCHAPEAISIIALSTIHNGVTIIPDACLTKTANYVT